MFAVKLNDNVQPLPPELEPAFQRWLCVGFDLWQRDADTFHLWMTAARSTFISEKQPAATRVVDESWSDDSLGLERTAEMWGHAGYLLANTDPLVFRGFREAVRRAARG
ncbi:MAG: hypothetical protein WKG01_07720 [Kofleriaceae bacterium]